MSIAALSAQTKLSSGHISLLERGEREPRLSALLALARGLGVSVAYLIEESQDRGAIAPVEVDRLNRVLSDPDVSQETKDGLLNIVREVTELAERSVATSHGPGSASASPSVSDLARQSRTLSEGIRELTSKP